MIMSQSVPRDSSFMSRVRFIAIISLSLFILLSISFHPSRVQAATGDKLSELVLIKLDMDGGVLENAKLSPKFSPETRNYKVIVGEQTLALMPSLIPAEAVIYVNDREVGHDTPLFLGYGTNIFSIKVGSTSSTPYVLTVLRGKPSPSVDLKTGFADAGNSVEKALPLNDGRVLFISNEYIEGKGSIFITDPALNVVASSDFGEHMKFYNFAPLPGSGNKYILLGYDSWEGQSVFLIVQENTSAHKIELVNDLDPGEFTYEYENIISVVPVSDNAFMVLAEKFGDGPYYTLERFQIAGNTITNVVTFYLDQINMVPSQMIKGIEDEHYVVVGNGVIPNDIEGMQGGLSYKLKYTPDTAEIIEEGSPVSSTDVQFTGVTKTADGYAIIGYESKSNRLKIIKLGANNVPQLDKTIAPQGIIDFVASQIRPAPDGGYIILASAYDDLDIPVDIVIKTAGDLTPVWQKSFAMDGMTYINDLAVLNDGSSIIAGSIYPFMLLAMSESVDTGYIAKIGREPMPAPSSDTTVTAVTYGEGPDKQFLALTDSKYKLDVNSVTSSVYFDIEPLDTYAAVSVKSIAPSSVSADMAGNRLLVNSLQFGMNEIKFTVKAEDGITSHDYFIQVYRPKAAEIRKITDGSKELFKTGETLFEYAVNEQTNTLTLQLHLQEPASTISLDAAGTTVTGVTYSNTAKQITFSQLQKGKNTVAVVVKAPDNSILKYFISIDKTVLSNNADLAGINSNIAGAAAKKPDGNYEMVVSPQTEKLIIEPLLPSGAVIVQVVGGIPNADGSFTNEPKLNFGINEMVFTVQAENGSTKNTKLTIIRRPPLLQDITGLINQAKDMNNDGKFTREDVLIILQWIPPVYVNPILTAH